MDCLRDSCAALAHGPAIASYPSYPVFPTLAVLSITFAFVDQGLEFGSTVLVLYLVWRQAGDNIISMGQQQSDESDSQRRDGLCKEPCSRRVVGCY